MGLNVKVSVIIPTYNREDTILNSVQSVLSQNYSNIEVIVVDDHSLDNTMRILDNISDERFKYIVLEENMGACFARNFGIKKSTGEIIAFQDSDDVWQPDKLEIQLNCLKKYHADICFCAYTKNGKIFPKMSEGVYSHEQLSCNSLASTQTIIAKKNIFPGCLFNEKMPRLQDFDWMIRASRNNIVCFSNHSLVNVYVQKNSISRNSEKFFYALNYLINENRTIEKENPQILLSWMNLLAAEHARNGKSTAQIYKEMLNYSNNRVIYIKYFLAKLNLITYYYKLRGYVKNED